MRPHIPAPLWSALLCALAAGGARAEAVSYVIDPDHTSVVFRVDHVGFTHTVGWFGKVGGQIVFDAAKPETSSVTVAIDAASITTNQGQRDAWIRSDKLLDAEKFPTIVFISRKVDVAGPDAGTIEGTLKMRGVEKPVALRAVLRRAGVSPIGGKDTIGFSATTSFRRSDFGASGFLGPLGDEIAVSIEAEGVKAR